MPAKGHVSLPLSFCPWNHGQITLDSMTRPWDLAKIFHDESLLSAHFSTSVVVCRRGKVSCQVVMRFPNDINCLVTLIKKLSEIKLQKYFMMRAPCQITFLLL